MSQDDVDLAACLALPKLFEASTAWDDNRYRMRVAGYLASELPPLRFVTSVRAIVLRADHVLLMRNPDSVHILPGGRREPGESILATLRRELLEETGWTIAQPSLLEFLHFHHLSPKEPGYAYPHPDFLHVIYVTEAATGKQWVPTSDEYEQEARFVPSASLATSQPGPEGLPFLPYALQARVVQEHPADAT